MALKKFVFDATMMTVAQVYRATANLLVLPVLARFLSPADFGLAAAAISVAFLANELADAGLANSLVRTPFEDRTVWSSVFWTSMLWAVCLGALLLAAALPIARLLNQPRLTPLIALLAVLPLGPGLLAAPVADLQQRHRFGWLAASDVVGSTAGVAFAVWLAISGAGPWALVAQPVVSLLAKAVVVGIATRFRPQFALKWHLIGDHVQFARDTSAKSFVQFLSTQMDKILIARVLGASALGQYSMAYRIMSLPQILGSTHGALYTRLVKLREDEPAFRRLILIGITVTGIIVFPPMALLCVASKSIFTVVLSPRWIGAATIFSYFAPVGALRAITSLHAIVFMATGRTDTQLKVQVEGAVLWIVVLVSIVHLGVVAVSIGLTVSVLAYYPRMLSLFVATIGCRVNEYIYAIRVPVLSSIIVGFIHVGITILYPLSPVGQIGIALIELPISYVIIILFMRRRLLESLSISRTLLQMVDNGS